MKNIKMFSQSCTTRHSKLTLAHLIFLLKCKWKGGNNILLNQVFTLRYLIYL